MTNLEYHARVYVKSKLHYFPLMKDRLGLDRGVLFRSTCFGRWLDLTYVENDEDLIHYMLLKQKVSNNDRYDLPLIYEVNGHTLHFGRREFCLITGFKFGKSSFRKFREGDISFRDRVFPEKIGEHVKNIDLLYVIEDEERFSCLSDEDSIRVCLLLSLEVIFMGHELGYTVDDVFLRMVDNLEAWNDFSWGEYIWRELYAAIRNVNSKHMDAHHKALERNPDCVPSYSLGGFVLCFKIWILESSSVTDRWWSKLAEEIPRGCFWSRHFLFQKWEYFGQLFPQAKKPKYDLYPNKAEALSEWFTKSNEFFNCYIPRVPPGAYEGLFSDYLMKLSSSRTHRTPMEVDNEIVVPSMGTLKNQKNMIDKYMIDRCQDLKLWKEDLNRPFASIENIYCDYYLRQFLKSCGWNHCKFPWCNDVVVDLSFWNSLIGLDDNRLGLLNNEHIELWVWYMWHFRQSCQDWSMVSSNFLKLLLRRESMPLYHATDEIYLLAWRDVEQVFIPMSDPNGHWSLARFHIRSGYVTFYDSQETFDVEVRPWYVKLRRCLESKLPIVLQDTDVFARKEIDPTRYSIKFRHEQNLPKQGGIFADCGVFVCLFLYRLTHGIPLDVEDPVQTALAYREKMANFFFKHKIICPP